MPPVTLISPEGRTVEVDDSKAQAYRDAGFREETGADLVSSSQGRVEAERKAGQGFLDQVEAAGLGVARGATFGASDVLADTFGVADRERQANLRTDFAKTSAFSELAGAVAPALLTGGESAVASVARATPAGLAARAGLGMAARGAERGAFRAIGAAALGGATEGALQSAGMYLSHTALEDADLSAEGLVAAAGTGGAYGAALGGAFGAGEQAFVAAKRLLPKAAGAGADAATRAAGDAVTTAVGRGRALQTAEKAALAERRLALGTRNLELDAAGAPLELKAAKIPPRVGGGAYRVDPVLKDVEADFGRARIGGSTADKAERLVRGENMVADGAGFERRRLDLGDSATTPDLNWQATEDTISPGRFQPDGATLADSPDLANQLVGPPVDLPAFPPAEPLGPVARSGAGGDVLAGDEGLTAAVDLAGAPRPRPDFGLRLSGEPAPLDVGDPGLTDALSIQQGPRPRPAIVPEPRASAIEPIDLNDPGLGAAVEQANAPPPAEVHDIRTAARKPGQAPPVEVAQPFTRERAVELDRLAANGDRAAQAELVRELRTRGMDTSDLEAQYALTNADEVAQKIVAAGHEYRTAEEDLVNAQASAFERDADRMARTMGAGHPAVTARRKFAADLRASATPSPFVQIVEPHAQADVGHFADADIVPAGRRKQAGRSKLTKAQEAARRGDASKVVKMQADDLAGRALAGDREAQAQVIDVFRRGKDAAAVAELEARWPVRAPEVAPPPPAVPGRPARGTRPGVRAVEPPAPVAVPAAARPAGAAAIGRPTEADLVLRDYFEARGYLDHAPPPIPAGMESIRWKVRADGGRGSDLIGLADVPHLTVGRLKDVLKAAKGDAERAAILAAAGPTKAEAVQKYMRGEIKLDTFSRNRDHFAERGFNRPNQSMTVDDLEAQARGSAGDIDPNAPAFDGPRHLTAGADAEGNVLDRAGYDAAIDAEDALAHEVADLAPKIARLEQTRADLHEVLGPHAPPELSEDVGAYRKAAEVRDEAEVARMAHQVDAGDLPAEAAPESAPAGPLTAPGHRGAVIDDGQTFEDALARARDAERSFNRMRMASRYPDWTPAQQAEAAARAQALGDELHLDYLQRQGLDEATIARVMRREAPTGLPLSRRDTLPLGEMDIVEGDARGLGDQIHRDYLKKQGVDPADISRIMRREPAPNAAERRTVAGERNVDLGAPDMPSGPRKTLMGEFLGQSSPPDLPAAVVDEARAIAAEKNAAFEAAHPGRRPLPWDGGKDVLERQMASMSSTGTAGAAVAGAPAVAARGGVLGMLGDLGAANEALRMVGVRTPFDPEKIPVIGPLLGLYLKGRALSAVAGGLGGRVAANGNLRAAVKAAGYRDRVAGAIDSLLSLGQKVVNPRVATVAIAAAPPVADTLARALHNDGAKRKNDSLAEKLRARFEELESAAQNPDAVRKGVVKQLLAAGVTSPRLVDAAVEVNQRRIDYLYATAPSPPIRAPLQRGEWMPPPAEAARFARRIRTAYDPASAIANIGTGVITKEEVETLRAVYPSLYAEAQTRLLERAAELEHHLPHGVVVKLATMFGVDLTPTLKTFKFNAIQAAGQPPPQAPPPAASGSPMKFGDAYPNHASTR